MDGETKVAFTHKKLFLAILNGVFSTPPKLSNEKHEKAKKMFRSLCIIAAKFRNMDKYKVILH